MPSLSSEMNNKNASRIFLLLFYLALICTTNAFCFSRAASDSPSRIKSLYFALQTMTTTGYGNGINFTEDVMAVACVFMIVGCTAWIIALAIVVNLILPNYPCRYPLQ